MREQTKTALAELSVTLCIAVLFLNMVCATIYFWVKVAP
jgi:hypothetical protein